MSTEFVIDVHFLDTRTVAEVTQQVAEALAGVTGDVVVDVSRVVFMDSTGLGLLVSTARLVRERGGQLSLAGASHRTRRLLQITGLTEALPLVP